MTATKLERRSDWKAGIVRIAARRIAELPPMPVVQVKNHHLMNQPPKRPRKGRR